MRIRKMALLSCLACFMGTPLMAQDGPSLVDQLTGGRIDNDQGSEQGPSRKDSIIQIDEIDDDLKIPLSDKVHETVTGLPIQSNTMEEVRTAYGDPFEMRGPVGDPPITQWYYQDFVVYFEHDKVIHSVFKLQ